MNFRPSPYLKRQRDHYDDYDERDRDRSRSRYFESNASYSNDPYSNESTRTQEYSKSNPKQSELDLIPKRYSAQDTLESGIKSQEIRSPPPISSYQTFIEQFNASQQKNRSETIDTAPSPLKKIPEKQVRNHFFYNKRDYYDKYANKDETFNMKMKRDHFPINDYDFTYKKPITKSEDPIKFVKSNPLMPRSKKSMEEESLKAGDSVSVVSSGGYGDGNSSRVDLIYTSDGRPYNSSFKKRVSLMNAELENSVVTEIIGPDFKYKGLDDKEKEKDKKNVVVIDEKQNETLNQIKEEPIKYFFAKPGRDGGYDSGDVNKAIENSLNEARSSQVYNVSNGTNCSFLIYYPKRLNNQFQKQVMERLVQAQRSFKKSLPKSVSF